VSIVCLEIWLQDTHVHADRQTDGQTDGRTGKDADTDMRLTMLILTLFSVVDITS